MLMTGETLISPSRTCPEWQFIIVAISWLWYYLPTLCDCRTINDRSGLLVKRYLTGYIVRRTMKLSTWGIFKKYSPGYILGCAKYWIIEYLHLTRFLPKVSPFCPTEFIPGGMLMNSPHERESFSLISHGICSQSRVKAKAADRDYAGAADAMTL